MAKKSINRKFYLQSKVKNAWPVFTKFAVESLKAFLIEWEGASLWITIIIGNARSLAQNAFFHGPLIDAFVRATGDTNREKWKARLKDMFLRVYDDPLNKDIYWVRETSALNIGEFMGFINDCLNYLLDELHGYLEAREYQDYQATLGKDSVDIYKQKGGSYDGKRN